MNEILITDLVAQQAMDQLAELDRAMELTLDKFQGCARELANGLKINVAVTGDLDKLQQITQTQMQQATQAAQQYTQQMQQQQQVIANTTNTISRQLMEQEKVNKAQREAYQQDQQALNIANQILGSREANYKQLAKYTAEMKKCKDQMRELDKQEKSGLVTADQAATKRARLMQQYDKTKVAAQELSRVLSVENKNSNAAAGSYAQLSQQLERMKQAYKQLNDQEKAGAPGQALEAEIQKLDAHLKDLGADMGEFQRNVGNYAVANGSLKQQLREMTSQLAEMNIQYQNMSRAEQQSAEGQALKQKITELTQKAGELKDAFTDAQQAIKNTASDTSQLDMFAEAGKTIAASFGLANSALQAFGMSEKSVEQQMLAVQKAMQAVQALTVIQNTLQKQSNLMRGVAIIQLKAQAVGENLVAAAQERGVVATKAATIAQKALNAVAKANPYVLLATAILAVVAAVVAWTSKTDDAAKSNEKLTESIKEQSGEFARARTELSRLRNEWDMLTSDKEREDWVKRNKEAFNQLGVQINNAKDAENLLVRNTNQFIKAMALRAQAAAYAAAAAKEFQSAIENRTEADQRKNNPTNWDKFMGVLMVGTDFNFKKSIGTQASSAAGKMEVNATSAESRAEQYIKQQAELLDKADKIMSAAGIKSSGGGTTKTTRTGGRGRSTSAVTKEALKDAEDFLDELLALQLDALHAATELLIEGTDEWAEIRNKELEAEKEAELKAMRERADKLEEELDKSVKEGKISSDKKMAILNDYYSNYTILEQSVNDKYKKAHEEVEEAVTRKKEENAAKRLESMQRESDDEITLINNQSAKELNELNKRYMKELQMANGNEKKIVEIKERYAREAERIARETSIRVLRATVDSLEQQVNIEDLSEDERRRIYEELAKAKIALEKAVTDAQVQEVEEQTEKDAERAQKFKDNMAKAAAATRKWGDFALEQFGKVSDLINAIYDTQIQKIEELIEEEQTRHEREIENIEDAAERGAITKEEAEIRKREAEKRTAQQQEQLEKRKAEISNKKNKIEKANAISKAAIDTAVAIMQTLAQYGGTPAGIALAALVGAMGAVQIASIVAQPIEAYAEGTKGKPHEGGLAVVGDGGRAELVMYGKKAWITPDSPTLVDLPKGAQVLPDAEKVMMRPDMLASIPRDNISGQPVIINDYHALEERMMNNTKTLAKSLNGFRESMTRELRRQRFRDYINRRT